MAGVSQGSVSLIERSESDRVAHDLTSKTLNRIAEVFGCSLDWLYLGKGKPPSPAAIRANVAKATKRAAQAMVTDSPKGRSKARLQSSHSH